MHCLTFLAWQDKNSKDLTNNSGYENLLDVSTLQEEWNCMVLTSVHPTVKLWNCRSLHWVMLVSVSETTWAPPFGLELACLSRDSPVTIYRPRYGHGRKCGFAAVNSDKKLSVLSLVNSDLGVRSCGMVQCFSCLPFPKTWRLDHALLLCLI